MDRHTRMLWRLVEDVMLDEAIRLSRDSIDDQVDSILLRFESDCIVDEMGPKEQGVGAEGVLRRSHRLTELRGDEDDDKDEPDTDEDKGGPADATQGAKDDLAKMMVGDQDDAKPDVESDPLKPKIDLHKFAGKVSRLATNYDALLDMHIALGNRAKNYLEQNYSREVAEEFVEIMEREFDIELETDETGEPRETPYAVGAAASGLSGG